MGAEWEPRFAQNNIMYYYYAIMPDDHVHVTVLLEVIMPIMGKPLT